MSLNQEKIGFLEEVIDKAKKKGVSGCDIILTAGSSLSLKANDGQLDEYKVAKSNTLGIRVIKDQKVGISYSESLDSDAVDYMIDSAINNSSFSKINKYESINGSEQLIEGTNDKIFQKDDSSTEEKIDFALRLESEIKNKDKHVKNAPYNNLSESEGEIYILNSKGSKCHQKSRSFSCYTSALIERDNDNSMYYEGKIARTFKELDIDHVVNETYKHANALINASQIKTGKYNVIFSPNMLSQVFGCFSSLFSAKSAVKGMNPFKDKIGTQVASNMITITDKPQYEEGFSFTTFDDEGLMAKDATLIENGILKTFYHNSATAAELGCDNTHHASRGPRSTLGVSGTNMVISTGYDEKEDLYDSEVVYIIHMQGLHSGSNSISGDFSFGASGYVMKDGEEIPFKNVTVSGNFFEMLKEIDMVGNTLLSNEYKSFFAPEIRFRNLSIGGS